MKIWNKTGNKFWKSNYLTLGYKKDEYLNKIRILEIELNVKLK